MGDFSLEGDFSLDTNAAMRRAIALAWSGWGRTGANPLVGAVLLKDRAKIAEAHHAAFGGPHAEAAAIAAAGEAARGAELVVTLEPCTHYGKTPPCTDAIVAAGVAKVVYGARDPNTVAAGGAERLRQAGVEVEQGPFEREIRDQNAAFFHRYECTERPYVAVKLAISLDARIADAAGRSKWVSGPDARDYVHWLRAGFDAIAIGAGTAQSDDPQLTVRGSVTPARPPLRVVFDDRGEVSAMLNVFRSARETPSVVITAPGVTGNTGSLDLLGVARIEADGPEAALKALRAQGVASLLVEGGGVLASRLMAAGLVDRLYLIQAPVFLGPAGVNAFPELPDTEISSAPRWRVVGRRTLGGDSVTVLDRR